MFVSCVCVCFVGSGLFDGLIAPTGESYRVCVCVCAHARVLVYLIVCLIVCVCELLFLIVCVCVCTRARDSVSKLCVIYKPKQKGCLVPSSVVAQQENKF